MPVASTRSVVAPRSSVECTIASRLTASGSQIVPNPSCSISSATSRGLGSTGVGRACASRGRSVQGPWPHGTDALACPHLTGAPASHGVRSARSARRCALLGGGVGARRCRLRRRRRRQFVRHDEIGVHQAGPTAAARSRCQTLQGPVVPRPDRHSSRRPAASTPTRRAGTTEPTAPAACEDDRSTSPGSTLQRSRERLTVHECGGCRLRSPKIERVTLPLMTTRQLLIGGGVEWRAPTAPTRS